MTMGVAFVMVHGGALTGEHSGELAYLYLVGFAVLAIAGDARGAPDRDT
jgi:putative oxidoreductase